MTIFEFVDAVVRILLEDRDKHTEKELFNGILRIKDAVPVTLLELFCLFNLGIGDGKA